MKKNLLLSSFLFIGIILSASLNAQQRYLDEIFTDVTVTPAG
jgi:hypothetical protein